MEAGEMVINIKVNNLLAFSDLSKQKVGEMVINFVTSDTPPEKRAEILYWFKEVAKQIELMDKFHQTNALETLYNNSKEQQFGKALLGNFEIIRKDASTYEYPPEVQEHIEILEQQLTSLKKSYKDERIKTDEKFTYYLKESIK